MQFPSPVKCQQFKLSNTVVFILCVCLLQSLHSKAFSERQVLQIRRLVSKDVQVFEGASGYNGMKAGNSRPATNKH